jgi:hypothetical protein
MVHEVPDQTALFAELHSSLKPGAHLFIAEPGMHVTEKDLEQSVSIAVHTGFTLESRPKIRMSRAAVFKK